MARELSEAAGISFIIGFATPTGDSYPRLVRNLNYRHIDDLIEYRLPIRTLWAERVALRAGPLRPVYERHVERTLRAYTPVDPVLANSLIADGFAATDRTRAFLEYKSFAGSRVIDVDAGRVWLSVKRGLLVGDLEAVSDADMRKATRTLERLAVRLGVHRILFQASKDTRFSRLAAQGFQPSPALAVLSLNLRSQIPSEKLRFTFGDLDNF